MQQAPSCTQEYYMCIIISQVLSKSVSDAFKYFGNASTMETEKFTLIFDRFFDCLNVRCLSEWKVKLKPDLKPYTSVDDPRLEVRQCIYDVYTNTTCV